METIEKTTTLFEPLSLLKTEIKNRIVMAPMTRSRAFGNQINDLMVTYYSQRATAGLIVTEGTSPSPNGIGYARTPGIYSEAQVEGWKKVTEAVHNKGGKIVLQLMHVGRIAHSANQEKGAKTIAPSAVQAQGLMWTDTSGLLPFDRPAEMTLEEIDQTKHEFVQGALNAIKAGFDGVELHGANGYLLEQFLNPQVNKRNDLYGGSVINRSRFILETVEEIAEAIGKEKVGIRFSPYSKFNDQPDYDEVYATYEYLSKEIDKIGIAYIHLVDYASIGHEEGEKLIKTIRESFKGVLIRNGGYTKERAEAVISNGEADLISFGTPFIPNPDLVERFKNNDTLAQPLTEFFYTADEKGYTDYSFAS